MTQFMGLMTDPFIAGRGDPVSSGSAPQFAEESDRASSFADNGKPRTRSERDAYAAIIARRAAWSIRSTHAGVCGRRVLAVRRRPMAMQASAPTPRQRASMAPPSAPTTVSRRLRWPVLRWPAAAPISLSTAAGSGRSDLFQAGAFVQHTVGAAYISAAPAYGWQDITTDRTVTIGGVDQLAREIQRQCLLRPRRRRLSLRHAVDDASASRLTPPDSSPRSTCPAYTEQALSGATPLR